MQYHRYFPICVRVFLCRLKDFPFIHCQSNNIYSPSICKADESIASSTIHVIKDAELLFFVLLTATVGVFFETPSVNLQIIEACLRSLRNGVLLTPHFQITGFIRNLRFWREEKREQSEPCDWRPSHWGLGTCRLLKDEGISEDGTGKHEYNWNEARLLMWRLARRMREFPSAGERGMFAPNKINELPSLRIYCLYCCRR